MIASDGTKTCPRCGQSKPPQGNFYRTGRASGDGYTGYCIPCTKASATLWQRALPEDRRKAKNKRDWQRAKLKPPMTLEQRARRSAAAKRWSDAHPEQSREWKRDYKKRNPEMYRQRTQVHSNHQRALRIGRESSFHWIDWVDVLERFHYRCAYCGAGDCLLDVEHIEPVFCGGKNIVGNIAPACRPCNAQKFRRTLEEFAALRGLSLNDIERIKSLAACPPVLSCESI